MSIEDAWWKAKEKEWRGARAEPVRPYYSLRGEHASREPWAHDWSDDLEGFVLGRYPLPEREEEGELGRYGLPREAKRWTHGAIRRELGAAAGGPARE